MVFLGIETSLSIPFGLTVDKKFVHVGGDLFWGFEYAGKLDNRATDFSLPVLSCSYLHNACKKLRHSPYFLKADKCSFILSIIMVYYMHTLLLWKQLIVVPKYPQHPVLRGFGINKVKYLEVLFGKFFAVFIIRKYAKICEWILPLFANNANNADNFEK